MTVVLVVAVALGLAGCTRGATSSPSAPAATAQPPERTAPALESSALGSSELAESQAALSRLQAQQTPEGILISVPDQVLFDFDKDVIRPDAGATLDDLVKALRPYADRPVKVNGHTDAKGSDAYNQDLSERRAQAVKAALGERGVDISKTQAQGFGERKPVAPNTNPNGSDNPEGRPEPVNLGETGRFGYC